MGRIEKLRIKCIHGDFTVKVALKGDIFLCRHERTGCEGMNGFLFLNSLDIAATSCKGVVQTKTIRCNTLDDEYGWIGEA